MALIQCSECKHEVSDKATSCPNCGCPLTPKKRNTDFKSLLLKYKTPLILVTLSIIILIGLVLIKPLFTSALDENEQLAYECALEMRDMLKDPDSFTLYDDMVILKKYNDDGELLETYTVFEFSGTNSYGAKVTDQAIFVDGEYCMTFSEELDVDDDLRDAGVKAFTKLAVGVGLSADEDDENWERIDIDTERIKSQMGLA